MLRGILPSESSNKKHKDANMWHKIDQKKNTKTVSERDEILLKFPDISSVVWPETQWRRIALVGKNSR